MKSLKATHFLALGSACLLVGALTAQSRDQLGDPNRGSSEIHAASKDQIPSGSKEPLKARYEGTKGSSETWDGSKDQAPSGSKEPAEAKYEQTKGSSETWDASKEEAPGAAKDATGQRAGATFGSSGGPGQGSGDVLNASKDTAPASPSQEPIGEDLPPGAQLSMEYEGVMLTFRISGHGSSQGPTMGVVLISFSSNECQYKEQLPPMLCDAAVLAAGIANPGFSASMKWTFASDKQFFAQGLLVDAETVHATEVLQVEAGVGKSK